MPKISTKQPKSKTVEIEVVTSESEHWYPKEKGEGYWPSVTTLLSVYPKGVGMNKYLVAQTSWENSQEILKSAGERGTRVHKGSELLEAGETLVREHYSLEEWEMLYGFVKWHKEFAPKVIHIEKKLVSDKLKTGGTLDRIYDIGGRITLWDLKTSKSIYGNYWVQTAVYAKMAEQKLGIKIDDTAILRPAPGRADGYEYKIHTRKGRKNKDNILVDSWEDDFKFFSHIQYTWNRLNPKAKPRELEIPTTLAL